MKLRANSGEHGYTMFGVLFLLGVGAIISLGMLSSAATNTKTRAIVNTRTDYYYEVEETLNNVVNWLDANSTSIVDAFTAANFNTNFDLGSPSAGDNEGTHFSVPTLVKMKGSNNSVLLSTNDFFGTSAFPSVTDTGTAAVRDLAAEFAAANLGPANARAILVWARETDGNYEPVFRVDVVTGNNPDRGVHSFSYIYSTLNTSGASPGGFFGANDMELQTPNNDCYSYKYTYVAPGNWGRGSPRSNCSVNSDFQVSIKSQVYGDANSLLASSVPGVELLPGGGSVSGNTCMGPGCHNYTLPVFGDWNSYCGGTTTDVNVSSDTTIPPGCYRDITIANKKVLTMDDTSAPYYIRSINFSGSKGNLAFGNIPLGDNVTFYVEQPSSNYHLNGNRVVNGNNAPHQVIMNYIGGLQLTLNGTSEISMSVRAPNAHVDLRGNFNFYGDIQAQVLTVGGNARINYDEDVNGSAGSVNDMAFQIKKASQRYR